MLNTIPMNLVSLESQLKSQVISNKLLDAANMLATSMYKYKYKTSPPWTVENNKIVYLYSEDIAEVCLRHVGL